MSYQLCGKVQNLVPYEPNKGEYKIKMDANESWLPLPANIKRRLYQAVKKVALNRYPDPYAQLLCRAAAKYYNVGENNITAGNGSDELISIIIACLLQKNDRVLTFAPDFSMYSFYASLYEIECLTMEKSPDAPFNSEAVLKKMKEEKVRMLIFSNPCNPTSIGISRADVLKIVENTDALVVVDEAYMDFWDQSITDCYHTYNNLIILRTCSKAVGLAGIRLGFALANDTLTKVLRAVKSPYNVNSVTQAIGCEILSHGDFLRQSAMMITASTKLLGADLSALSIQKQDIVKVYPSNTNFVYLRMRSAAETYKALEERGIIVRRLGDYIRITSGSDTDRAALLCALKDILK